MTVELFRRTGTGNIYMIRDNAGRVIGQVNWIMAGADIGVHCYSHDSKYRPDKIRKIFRHNFPA